MRLLLLVFICATGLHFVRAQLLQPTITGDSLLCPEGTGVVSTQEYDTYQWFRRYYGSNNAVPLQGQVFRQLVMDYFNFAASYVSVFVTQSGQSAFSPEFFVDGYVFLPPYVIVDGIYTIGPEGEMIICPGDTLTFELGLPYNINITWYRNGQPIPGAQASVLKVASPGIYTVSGAPEVCPDYVQTIGVPLVVVLCPTSTETYLAPKPAFVFDSKNELLRLVHDRRWQQTSYRIFDAQGRLLRSGSLLDNSLSLSGIESGLIIIHFEGFHAVKMIKP